MRAYAAHVGASAPHERGARAGIVGGVGVDAVLRDGGEALGRARVVEACLYGRDIDFRRSVWPRVLRRALLARLSRAGCFFDMRMLALGGGLLGKGGWLPLERGIRRL